MLSCAVVAAEGPLPAFAACTMTEIYVDERGSTADSDADSALDESTSQESHSMESAVSSTKKESEVSESSFPSLKKEPSLAELLSQKPPLCASLEARDNHHKVALSMAPSTSTSLPSSSCHYGFDYTNGGNGAPAGEHDTPFSVKEEPHSDSDGATSLFSDRNHESSSPWMRNAGRKKSHPVWDFFKDLRAPDGSGGVVCLHCTWKGDDRSPNNLKTHLKRFHEHDGVYQQFAAKLAATPTQPYVKRNRASVSVPVSTSSCASTDAFTPAAPNSNSKFATNNNGLSAVRAALAQQQKSNEEKKTMNFLAMIPRSSEVINITAGFSGDEGKPPTANGAANSTLDENGEESGSFDSSGMVVSESRGTSSATVTGDVTPSVSSTSDQLQAAAILSAAASNPFMYMAAANALVANSMSEAPEKAASSFSLMDGECVATLMRVAVDLDCTFFFHCRGGQPHFCFEPNASAAERFNRGSELLLLDMENEIRIIERNGGVDVDSESWKKTDWTQFTWAIRGKCQKALLRR